MNSDFKDLLRLFADNQVRFLVVGGYAVILSKEDVITSKIASGRPQDLIDVELLRQTEQL